MIKIQNSQQFPQNDFNQSQPEQYKIKQSKMLPYQDQSIHAFYQVEVSQNASPIQEINKNIDIETRLCRIQTSSKNYPRIVKEVDIKLSNGQQITLRDIFTTLPKTISCKSEQILVGSHSSFLSAPYQQPEYQYQPQQQQQQQQQQSYQQPEQEQQEESTIIEHHNEHIKEHSGARCLNSSSCFSTAKLSTEIGLLSLKLQQLPLLSTNESLVNKAITAMKNESIPTPMGMRPIPAIAAAKKNGHILSHVNSLKCATTNKVSALQQQKRQEQQKQGGATGGEEELAGASSLGSLLGSSSCNDSIIIDNDNDDFINDTTKRNFNRKKFKVGGKVQGNDVFRVVRKNIRKEKRN